MNRRREMKRQLRAAQKRIAELEAEMRLLDDLIARVQSDDPAVADQAILEAQSLGYVVTTKIVNGQQQRQII